MLCCCLLGSLARLFLSLLFAMCVCPVFETNYCCGWAYIAALFFGATVKATFRSFAINAHVHIFVVARSTTVVRFRTDCCLLCIYLLANILCLPPHLFLLPVYGINTSHVLTP